MEEKKDLVSAFMLNKVYMQDYTNMINICGKKCFNNYDSPNPSANEQLCLERCFVKSLELNKHVVDDYYNKFNPSQ